MINFGDPQLSQMFSIFFDFEEIAQIQFKQTLYRIQRMVCTPERPGHLDPFAIADKACRACTTTRTDDWKHRQPERGEQIRTMVCEHYFGRRVIPAVGVSAIVLRIPAKRQARITSFPGAKQCLMNLSRCN